MDQQDIGLASSEQRNDLFFRCGRNDMNIKAKRVSKAGCQVRPYTGKDETAHERNP